MHAGVVNDEREGRQRKNDPPPGQVAPRQQKHRERRERGETRIHHPDLEGTLERERAEQIHRNQEHRVQLQTVEPGTPPVMSPKRTQKNPAQQKPDGELHRDPVIGGASLEQMPPDPGPREGYIVEARERLRNRRLRPLRPGLADVRHQNGDRQKHHRHHRGGRRERKRARDGGRAADPRPPRNPDAHDQKKPRKDRQQTMTQVNQNKDHREARGPPERHAGPSESEAPRERPIVPAGG